VQTIVININIFSIIRFSLCVIRWFRKTTIHFDRITNYLL